MKNKLLCAALILGSVAAQAQQRKTNPALDSLNNIKDPIQLQKKLKSLGAGNEDDMTLLYTYLQYSKKSADSIEVIALKRFPKGKLALGIATKKIFDEKDPLIQEATYNSLKKDYPAEDFMGIESIMANNFANNKNAKKALFYLDQLKGNWRSRAVAFIPSIVMMYDPKAAEEFVVKEMSSTELDNGTKISLLNIYSQMLYKKGEYAKAFEAFKSYYDQASRKTPRSTAQYYLLMSKTGNFKEAFPELEKAAIAGIGGEEIRTELKNAYVKLNPNQSADTYMVKIKTQINAKYLEKATEKMINEKSPDFTVTDLSGKSVSLADYKGKTIVLDFWATWCGPCKRSLPAMQATVDQFKDDPNVKFLFIHTWEQSKTPTEDAKKYFADNKFRLPLFMDLKDLSTNKNNAVSAFGVSGIPAKFIIDAKGNIRFKMTGFGGTDEEAVSELSAMIGLAKAG
jgi:peroxiredoxin